MKTIGSTKLQTPIHFSWLHI